MDTADSVGGAVTGSVAVFVAPPNVPVIVTGVDALTAAVVTSNVALVAPAATVTLAGTVATAVLLLDSVTTAPPVGAAIVNVAVPREVLPPATLVGLSAIADNAAIAGAASGWKRSVADHGPAAPAESIPRTRHQCRTAANPPVVNCDGVTTRPTMSGVVNVLESSTWISYDVAPITSVQSKATGCTGVALLAGDRSVVGPNTTVIVAVAESAVPNAFDTRTQ